MKKGWPSGHLFYAGEAAPLPEAWAAKITSIEAHAAQKPSATTSLPEEISTQLRHRDDLRLLQ
jgi:hypothetical protein